MGTIVIGRDDIGAIAQDDDGYRWYLTDCCGASAKGMQDYVGCRACYYEIDPALGDVPGKDMVMTAGGGVDFRDKPLNLTEVYGDGIPYEQWKRQHVGTTRREAVHG